MVYTARKQPPNTAGNGGTYNEPGASKLLAFAGAVVLSAFAGYSALHGSSGQPVMPPATDVTDTTNRLLVKYRDTVGAAAVVETAERLGATAEAEISQLRIKAFRAPDSQRESIKQALAADPNVEYVEYDQPRYLLAGPPNDPLWPQQLGFKHVGLESVWDKTEGSGGVTIAIIDTGVLKSHFDLSDKMLPGRDFVNNDDDPADDHGHGTATSLTAAAVGNNTAGTAGVCWHCKILPIKAFNASGASSGLATANAIRYAADSDARIINMSFGTLVRLQAEQDAVAYAVSKGKLAIASAGNNGVDWPVYPAQYPGVLSVAATNDTDDNLADYSSFGKTVGIAAPGKVMAPDYPTTSSYKEWKGTSFSGPTVAGAASLLLTAFPKASNAQIIEALTKSAVTCCGGKIGGGRLDVPQALTYLEKLMTNPTPTPKRSDLNNDGKVNISDLSKLLSSWGKSNVQADINNSGKVDVTDLSMLLSDWTG